MIIDFTAFVWRDPNKVTYSRILAASEIDFSIQVALYFIRVTQHTASIN